MAAALLTLTADAALTAAFARALAPELGAGDTLLLDGPVGAGKSHFARALIRARLQNPAEDVPSPTFTLVEPYQGEDYSAYHFDLYRLADPEDEELGGLDRRHPDQAETTRPASRSAWLIVLRSQRTKKACFTSRHRVRQDGAVRRTAR